MATLSLQRHNSFPSFLTMTWKALRGWHLLPADVPSDDSLLALRTHLSPLVSCWSSRRLKHALTSGHVSGALAPLLLDPQDSLPCFSRVSAFAGQPVYTLSTVWHSVSLSPGHLHPPPKHLAYDCSVRNSVASTIPSVCCW